MSPSRPSRSARGVLRRGLLALCLLGSSALAGSFPGFDAQRETVLLGSVAGQSPDGAPTALIRGDWALDDSGLSMVQPFWQGDNWWFPEHPRAYVDDGLVRARFVPGSRLDSTLMARVQLDPTNLDDVSGYGLSVARDDVQLLRWDAGRAMPISEELRVTGLSGHRNLELTLVLAGPVLIGQVWDGRSFELLATISAHDPTYDAGRVGFRAYKKQDLRSRITLLSVMDHAASQAEHDDPHLYGSRRSVLIAADDLAKLPAGLSGSVEYERLQVGDGPAQAVLEVDSVGWEQLVRADIAIANMASEFPWGLTDLRYREAKLNPVRRSGNGFVTHASYKDNELVGKLLAAYHQRFPQLTKLVELGRTHQGRPIWALRITDNPELDEDEPAMLLDGAHHGSELLSIDYTLDAVALLLERYQTDPHIKRYVDNLDIWAVPLVNPDGNHYFMEVSREGGRKNGRDTNADGRIDAWDGVDLNRNYPFRWGALGEKGSKSWHRSFHYRGPAPASEPETQAMMRLADTQHFAAAISYHTVSTVLIAPYSIDGTRSPQPDVAKAVGEDILAALPLQPNRRRFKVVNKIYSVDGVDQDWHYFQHGTLAYILEGSHHNPRRQSTRMASIEATRPAFQALFQRFLDGPSISGHVSTKSGEPIEAVVEIAEIQTHEGELWTSRPRDGRYDRFVATKGSYTVTARARGWQPVSQTVRVDGHVTLDLVLKKHSKKNPQASD